MLPTRLRAKASSAAPPTGSGPRGANPHGLSGRNTREDKSNSVSLSVVVIPHVTSQQVFIRYTLVSVSVINDLYRLRHSDQSISAVLGPRLEEAQLKTWKLTLSPLLLSRGRKAHPKGRRHSSTEPAYSHLHITFVPKTFKAAL